MGTTGGPVGSNAQQDAGRHAAGGTRDYVVPNPSSSRRAHHMAQTKATARKLATKAEWTLLEPSFPPLLKELTPGRLKQKIVRARKLADKYRDKARQQKGEARGKRDAKGTRAAKGAAGTVRKQELFAEARTRFEAQLEKLEAKAAKEAAKALKAAERAEKAAAKRAKAAGGAVKSAAKKAGTAAKRAARDAAATARKAVSKASRGARKSAVFTRTSSRKHQAHVGARGRRRQARRDSR
jgi:hypothetical protein